jgi:iron(III) transport system permease protein
MTTGRVGPLERVRGAGSALRSNPALLIPLAGALVLIYLVVFPLVMLLLGSFRQEVAPREFELTFKNYAEAYSSQYTYGDFVTSAIFATGSAALSFVFGTALAWLVERTNVPFARVILPIAIVPLILPGILEATAWVFLLSPAFGVVNVTLMAVFGLDTAPINIYSLPGMIWVQGVGQSPLAFLMMSAAFKLMDPSLEEGAQVSGASGLQTFRRVTLPLLRPWIAAVVLLMVVRSLEAFEVPAIIGIPARTYVYTSEIYLAFSDFPPNYGLGSALAVGLLVLSTIGVWLYLRAVRNSSRFETVSGKAFRPRRIDLGRLRWPAFGVILAYGLFVVALPLSIIAWASFLPYFAPPSLDAIGRMSFDNYDYLFNYDPFYVALRNSVFLAVVGATTVMFLTSLIAWLLHKSRLPGMGALEFLAMVPIAIPGLVLGMALIIQYVNFPLPFYGTVWVLLIAYSTKYLPYGLRNATAATLQIRGELEEAAAMSGATWWQTFRRVTLPLLRPGLAAGWIYVAIVSFREFSTSILLATGESTVLSIQVWKLLEFGKTTAVAALGVLMILSLVAIVAIFYRLTGRVGIQA